MGAHDNVGLATEVDVDLEVECEDLNVDLNTWDVQTDSPEPHSPKDADALDCCVLGIDPPADASFDVLREVPSTQPGTPPCATGLSARQMRARPRKRTPVRPLPASVPSTAAAPPTTTASLPPTTGSEHSYSVGRGILRLRAPPKLGRTPAPRRRPPPCADLPEPQWAIRVTTPPLVQYRVEAPENANRMPETQDIFRVADEDLRPPASGSWVDIVDREVREGTAVTSSAPLTTWAIGAPIVAASISTTAATTVVGASIPTTVLEMTEEPSASPTVIASTPDGSQPELVAASTASTEPTSGSTATTTAPPLLTASVSQIGTRPVLRYSDIAYAVRLSQARQTEWVADSLLANFHTTRTREELPLLHSTPLTGRAIKPQCQGHIGGPIAQP